MRSDEDIRALFSKWTGQFTWRDKKLRAGYKYVLILVKCSLPFLETDLTFL